MESAGADLPPKIKARLCIYSQQLHVPAENCRRLFYTHTGTRYCCFMGKSYARLHASSRMMGGEPKSRHFLETLSLWIKRSFHATKGFEKIDNRPCSCRKIPGASTGERHRTRTHLRSMLARSVRSMYETFSDGCHPSCRNLQLFFFRSAPLTRAMTRG